MKDTIQIALDGPSGAGKSTIAKRLAAELGYIYLDTGAMYRAASLKALRLGLAPGDEAAVAEIPGNTAIAFGNVRGELRIYLDGEDVSAAIREHQVSMAASDISKHAAIRAWLGEVQREMARRENVIMDGRDIGTRVLPGAQLKFFLTATPEVRARRRYEELKARGQDVEFQTVLDDVNARDLQDTTRENDPLRPAADAVIVDTSDMSFEQVVAFLLERVGTKR